ncbi:O-antigen ligase family protein [Cellulomonas sp. NS3]|uniref:O-antigen ligase family protein n=1 Tax=Cellulomonas sp. NS3 TaxID=2973977 RepID=UPI0021621174|nr:O-antigen ligase family protein [Cellulomonas sp. NS3]
MFAATPLVAAAAVLEPRLLLVVPGIAALLALAWPWGRLTWFVGGAMVVFQTSAGLTMPKVAYVAGVAVALLLAAPGVARTLRTWGVRFRPGLWGAALLAGWLAVATSIQSLGAGVPVESWARDALTYFLVCAAVVFGIDAASVVSVRAARAVTACVGVVVAYGFATSWIQRRGLAAESGQVLLASMVALVVPISLAIVLALAGRGARAQWLALAGGLVGAVLLTGTRTGVVLLAPALGVIGAPSKGRVRASKILVGMAVALGVIAAALFTFGSRITGAGFQQARIRDAVRAFTEGVSQDGSGSIRIRAYEYAEGIFRDSPLLGQGLGVFFPNPNPGGGETSFSLDTPWVLLAKFGLVGAAVLVAALTLIVLPCFRPRGDPPMLEAAVASGSVVGWLAILPFGPPTEDKGFAISIALLLMLVGSAARTTAAATTGDGDDQTSSASAPALPPPGLGRSRSEVLAAAGDGRAGTVAALERRVAPRAPLRTHSSGRASLPRPVEGLEELA